MRGRIVKRGKTYSVVIYLGRHPGTGKKQYQWTTVKGTEKDAEKKRTELLRQLDTGTFVKPTKTTLGDYLNGWLESYCKPNLAPRTYEGYESIVRVHIAPALGKVTLTALQPEQFQKFYGESVKSGLSNRSVQHHHTLLHKALKSAVRLGLVNRNVTDFVDVPKAHSPEMQIMADAIQIDKLLTAAKDTPYYEVFYLAIFTGMRRSELLGLKWPDIDFTEGQEAVSVQRALHRLRTKEFVFRTPKRDKSRRLIDLPPSAVAMLKEYKKKHISAKDGLLFCHPDGTPLTPDNVTNTWIRTAKKAGLEGVTLHGARHTFASLLLSQGVHLKVVQELLGHADISTTANLYSHVLPGMKRSATHDFDKIALAGKQTEKQGQESQAQAPVAQLDRVAVS